MNVKRNHFTCGLIAASMAALSSAPASAQWWWPPTGGLAVSPACLDPQTQISLTVSGDWPDHCIPNFSSGVASGNEVDVFTVRDPPPGICFSVITHWEQTVHVGPLAPGAYTVFATHLVAGVAVHPRTMVGAFTVVAVCEPACYVNCDGSTTPPALNINDFVCFNNRFAAGDSYANCDNSSAPPILNVIDFVCFMNRYAAGCG